MQETDPKRQRHRETETLKEKIEGEDGRGREIWGGGEDERMREKGRGNIEIEREGRE